MKHLWKLNFLISHSFHLYNKGKINLRIIDLRDFTIIYHFWVIQINEIIRIDFGNL